MINPNKMPKAPLNMTEFISSIEKKWETTAASFHSENWQKSITKGFGYTLPNSFMSPDKTTYQWAWHIREAELAYKDQMLHLPELIRIFSRGSLNETHITRANDLLEELDLQDYVDISDTPLENSGKLQVMLDKAFDHLSTAYLLLFQKKNNLLAGYELIKLFAQVHSNDFAALTSEEKIDFDICEIAFELIEKHKFCIPEIQKYIGDILDATAAKKHKIRQEYILNETVIKILSKRYSEGEISLQQILRLPQKDLRLLLTTYLPMLIKESNEEEENYSKLEKDIRKNITEDYLPVDINIKQNISKDEFHSLLGMKVNAPIDYSSESDAEVEDFAEEAELNNSVFKH